MPAIIRINLETGSVSRREQEKDDLLLGGRRLTGSIIAAEVPPECEPLIARDVPPITTPAIASSSNPFPVPGMSVEYTAA